MQLFAWKTLMTLWQVTAIDDGRVDAAHADTLRTEAWILEQTGIVFDAKAAPGELRAVA